MTTNEIITFLKTWEGNYSELPEDMRDYLKQFENKSPCMFEWFHLWRGWTETDTIDDVPYYTCRMHQNWHTYVAKSDLPPKICENCRFMRIDNTCVRCHRYAPRPHCDDGRNHGYAYWPIVGKTDSCGQFEPNGE